MIAWISFTNDYMTKVTQDECNEFLLQISAYVEIIDANFMEKSAIFFSYIQDLTIVYYIF